MQTLIKTQIYNKLKPQKFLFLKNVKPLINTTPLPTNSVNEASNVGDDIVELASIEDLPKADVR